ncbi:hypothetical protein F5Y15DRAFT_401592 [Xylariaceae sp. FL0016]|nr:hypothetical protein F5Y15DRAFT_401592 [Xylariaceae sp. FL0016]
MKCSSFTVCFLQSAFLAASAAWGIPFEYAIEASPDGHFFQDQNGSPFFWQADTAWLLFHRLNYSECEIYLSDRASKGFNMVLAVGFTQIGINSPNRNGDLVFVDEDPAKPSEPYWSYIDSIVELAWSKGIRIAMVPAWGYYVHSSDNEPSVLNHTNVEAFGQFIGTRYPYLPKILFADTNPWWTNKTAVKDNYARGGITPSSNLTDWSAIYTKLATGITNGEREVTSEQRWQPLITIHPTNQWFEGGPTALASAQVGDHLWLTFDSSQSGHADYPPNPPLPWWNCRRGWEPMEFMYAVGESTAGKKRPALDNEPHYENRFDNGKSDKPVWNASDVRVGSWHTVFSGAAGVTYGAENVMQMYNPDLYESAGSGPAIPWSEDLVLPGSNQMQTIKQAILDRGNSSFWTRIPAQDIVVGNPGADDKRVTATRDSEGFWLMVYTPTGEDFTIETGSLGGCDVEASWFDPVAGTYSAFNYTQCEGLDSRQLFTPPAAEEHADWVLVLEVERE